MSLTKEKITEISRITPDFGQVHIKEIIIIKDNGEIISSVNHRRVIHPGDDLSKENEQVKAHCQVEHTPVKINKWKDFLKEQEEKNNSPK